MQSRGEGQFCAFKEQLPCTYNHQTSARCTVSFEAFFSVQSVNYYRLSDVQLHTLAAMFHLPQCSETTEAKTSCNLGKNRGIRLQACVPTSIPLSAKTHTQMSTLNAWGLLCMSFHVANRSIMSPAVC